MAIIRAPYDGEAIKVGIDTGPSMTKQSHKDECDINRIMSKYQKTGIITHVAKYAARYGEASDIDYQTALNTVMEAQQMFADLPSTVRKRFDNDPAEFLQFVSDPGNVEEMRQLGLVEVPTEPIPIPVVVKTNQQVAGAASQTAPDPATTPTSPPTGGV